MVAPPGDVVSLDREVRLAVYRTVVADGLPPSAQDLAAGLGSRPRTWRARCDGSRMRTCSSSSPRPRRSGWPPVLGRPDAVRGHGRRAPVLRELHLGRPGDPRVPARGRADRHVLPRLRGADAPRGPRRCPPGTRRRRDPFRGAGGEVVGGHRRDLIDDAALPVGRARAAVGRRAERRLRRGLHAAAGMATRAGVVRGSAATSWRRRTPEEAHAIFASIGLTGPFWDLLAD